MVTLSGGASPTIVSVSVFEGEVLVACIYIAADRIGARAHTTNLHKHSRTNVTSAHKQS